MSPQRLALESPRLSMRKSLHHELPSDLPVSRNHQYQSRPGEGANLHRCRKSQSLAMKCSLQVRCGQLICQGQRATLAAFQWAIPAPRRCLSAGLGSATMICHGIVMLIGAKPSPRRHRSRFIQAKQGASLFAALCPQGELRSRGARLSFETARAAEAPCAFPPTFVGTRTPNGPVQQRRFFKTGTRERQSMRHPGP